MLPIGNPDYATSHAQVHAPRSAIYSGRHRGSGYGATAASITRHSRARRRSFAGEPMRRATCFASAHVVPAVAAEARPCSALVGPTLTPVCLIRGGAGRRCHQCSKFSGGHGKSTGRVSSPPMKARPMKANWLGNTGSRVSAKTMTFPFRQIGRGLPSRQYIGSASFFSQPRMLAA